MKFLLAIALFVSSYSVAIAEPLPPVEGSEMTYQQYALSLVEKEHHEALLELVQRESGWNSDAQNPVSTAYGLFQFLDGTWDDVGCVKTSSPKLQIDCGIKYIKQRYENPTEALRHHTIHNWY